MKNPPTCCVLIAEDDEDDRFLLRLAFEEQGLESKIAFAVDGLDLLIMLSELALHPVLIILDINMPKLNGFEVINALRGSKSYRNTPIVILTTSTDESDLQRAYDLGADEYMVKPSRIEDLYQTVNRLVTDWGLTTCC